MTRILTILILFILNAQIFGQFNKKNNQKKKDDFIQQVEKINYFLKQYDTLSPFSDNDNRFELIDSISAEITSRLLKVLNDKRVINYQIENLLVRDEIMISKSADNNIYFFSIDEKTGGTARTSKTIIHYRLANGFVKADFFDGQPSELLATSTFGQIFLLDSLAKKYFVIGSFATCGTCIASLAITLQLDSDSISTQLIAQYDGRYYDLLVFDYDNELKEFNYEYYSDNNDYSLDGTDNKKSGLSHRYKNKFKYLNGVFIEIEKSDFLEKKIEKE